MDTVQVSPSLQNLKNRSSTTTVYPAVREPPPLIRNHDNKRYCGRAKKAQLALKLLVKSAKDGPIPLGAVQGAAVLRFQQEDLHEIMRNLYSRRLAHKLAHRLEDNQPQVLDPEGNKKIMQAQQQSNRWQPKDTGKGGKLRYNNANCTPKYSKNPRYAMKDQDNDSRS